MQFLAAPHCRTTDYFFICLAANTVGAGMVISHMISNHRQLSVGCRADRTRAQQLSHVQLTSPVTLRGVDIC
jgi:hypothetical protein